MTWSQRWNISLSALLTAALLAACGGGGSENSGASQTQIPTNTLAQEAGAPAFTGNTANDGFEWINFRRKQTGLPVMVRNSRIDAAAQNHSNYQTFNGISHTEIQGGQGFTGVDEVERVRATGYVFGPGTNFVGEVIAATSDPSGFFMAEELITAIYHRFAIFEPRYKEIGTGAATSSAAITYFTSNFATNTRVGSGLGTGKITVYPFDRQTRVPTNFLSDSEDPDPFPPPSSLLNEVGYPISVHADMETTLSVVSFTVRPRGGADLAVKILSSANDVHTPSSAAAIIPFAVLERNTVYDVTFMGASDGVAIPTRTWSFTTK